MTPAQDRVFQQVLGALLGDPRVLGVWLSGSFARGEGDAWSDIDFVAEVGPDDQAACVADYHRGQPGMPPALHALVVYHVIVSAVTDDWQRYDITFVTRPQMTMMDQAKLKPLSGAAHEPLPVTPRRPDAGAPARIEALVREFLRVAGLAPVGAGREEWLVMQQGVELLRHMTIDVMLEANGVGPADRGQKALNAHLTIDQRAALEALAPAPARLDALLAETQGLSRLFMTHARPLAARLGVAWPDAFEAATRRHLKATLSLEL